MFFSLNVRIPAMRCILGFEIEDGAKLLELPDAQTRKIEVYGDSVSAGEVTEAVDYTGKTDPEHQGRLF